MLLNSPLVRRAVRRHDWMPGVTGSSFDDIGMALEIGVGMVRCYGHGARAWAQVGVQGFTSGSRPLVREVADRLATEVGAPITTVRTGFGTPGPVCVEPPFFPVWAEVPWMNFDLDNWVSADIVAAAPELRIGAVL